ASGLLAPRAGRSDRSRRRGISRGGNRRQRGGRSGFRLASEEPLLEAADAGLEALVFLVEELFALDGPPVHGLPVSGLAPGLEFLSQAWADRTGTLGNGGSGTDGTGRRRGRRRRGPELVQF